MTRRLHRAGTLLAALCGGGLLLAGCSGSASTPAPTRTQTIVQTSDAPPPAPTPVDAGPTTAAAAADCPLVGAKFVHFTMGVRLGRLTVLHAKGHVVGCRFYALQGGKLHRTEHLPGPSQPVVEVTTQRYTSADGAHNAFVMTADKGTNPQPVTIGGHPGVCFQNDFYAKDKGQDWACGSSKGSTEVLVRTVDTTGTFGTMTVTRRVLDKL